MPAQYYIMGRGHNHFSNDQCIFGENSPEEVLSITSILEIS